MKLFISWAGERSKAVALRLRQWIPDILQTVKPWMSATDIQAGARWNGEMNRELGETSFGILCLTRDNTTAPWLLFEAGALAKSVEDSFVCPYLLDLEPAEVPSGPLTQFQAKRATRDETLDLVRAINRSLKEQTLTDSALERAFDLWWPSLDSSLIEIRGLLVPETPGRTVPDMTVEILELVRGLTRERDFERDKLEMARAFDNVRLRRGRIIRQVTSALQSDEKLRSLGLTGVGAVVSGGDLHVTGVSKFGQVRARWPIPKGQSFSIDQLTEQLVIPLAVELHARLREAQQTSPDAAAPGVPS